MVTAFVLGGVGAGSLQVLWGQQFSQHSVQFAAYALPMAAIVTAVVVALSASQVNSMGYAVVPLLSFALLLFHGSVMGVLGKLVSWLPVRRGQGGSFGETGDSAVPAGVADGAPEVGGGTATDADAGPRAAAGSSCCSADVAACAATGGGDVSARMVSADGGECASMSDVGLCTGASAESDSDAHASARRSVPLAIGKLMLSIMVFSLLTRMLDTMAPADGLFSFLGGSAVFSLVVVGVVFLAVVHKAGDRLNPTSIYRLSLPIMVAGYAAISLLLDAHAALSVLIINVGYELFDILAWVLFVDCARRQGENALHVFGLGVAFMFAGMALGNTAAHAIQEMVASGAVQMNMVAMVAVLCLVIVAFLVLPEGTVAQLSGSLKEARSGGDSSSNEFAGVAGAAAGESLAAFDGGAAPVEGRIERQCALVAAAYKLTPRESEVVVLLAYGRTLAIIARDLQIAKGTARTHIESIYRKLGVHKQQELIDLVEGFQA